MAATPDDGDTYPEPIEPRASGFAGVWRVLLLAIVFIAIAVGFSLYGEHIPGDVIVLFLGLLGVIGVFFLFALAAGLFRYSGGDTRRSLSAAIVDSLGYGALVADRDGRIVYANEHYAALSGATADRLPVGVPRLFASEPEASEAMYRLTRAAREGRPVSEDIRLSHPLREEDTRIGTPTWYRVAVRALPQVERGKSLVMWTVEDISRDRARQENIFLELQRAIDYLDHAPAGFFSSEANGRLSYINSTLADWLGYDLAAFDGSSLNLERHRSGRRRITADGWARRRRYPHRDYRHRPGARQWHEFSGAVAAPGGAAGGRRIGRDPHTGARPDRRRRPGRCAACRRESASRGFTTRRRSRWRRSTRRGASSTSMRHLRRIFGLTASERAIEMRPLSELISEEQVPGLKRAIADAVAPALGDRSARRQYRRHARSGGAALFQRFGIRRGQAGASDHLRSRHDRAKKARSPVRNKGQKMQAVGQLAGGVAHDFNNVLTAIIGFSDLLLLKHKPSDPSFSDIMSIKQSANRAAALVQAAAGLLAPPDASAAGAGGLDPYRRPDRLCSSA